MRAGKPLAVPLAIALCLASRVALAQAPQYTPQFLGTFTPLGINESGLVLGRTTVAGNSRALVIRAGEVEQLLPLPAGMISSAALDLNDLGVVVGAVGAFYDPEFSGQAARWTPDDLGGYTVDLLGTLPGQSISRATAVNNLGDIVGYSSDGPFRYPVWFTAPDGPMNLSSTGIFDPVDINDQRVLVDQSFAVNRLDLNTMVAQNLGVPGPNPFGTSYLATRSAAINESGQVAGSAILASSTSCLNEPARYSDGIGWEVFASCGQFNGASDINDLGDIAMSVYLVAHVRFEGQGTFVIQDVIVNGVGQWFPYSVASGRLNNSRQILIAASNPATGQSGALLLTPVAATAAPSVRPAVAGLHLSAAPNPFRPATTIRYDLPRSGPVTLTIHDVSGRVVRHVVERASQQAGTHFAPWSGDDDGGRNAASGVYFVRLQTSEGSRTSRLVRTR